MDALCEEGSEDMKFVNNRMMFKPDSSYPWMRSHAQVPTPFVLEDEVKIYFASRDDEQRSHVGLLSVNPSGGFDKFKLHDQPILEPGPFGGFDDHGVFPSSILKMGDELWMYYIGWNPSSSASIFYSTIGLAISKDNGESFEKYQNFPLVGRNATDPLLVTSPFVMIDCGVWRMWYVSGLKWMKVDNRWKSWYHIKYAESKDGINWKRDGHVAIDFMGEESNIARPWVIKHRTRYSMWYCKFSNSNYSLGYAESGDGLQWVRKDDQVQIPKLACGSDSSAQAYPSLFVYQDKFYLLYNGNQFGKDGFAIAELI